MQFKGLFIGIDKYSSPNIRELSCSANDAKALYSLFSDAFGKGCSNLLVNEEAKYVNIIARLNDLKEAHENDFVVISFSGHGSDDHALVLHDTDPNYFENTTLDLNDLVEHFKEIPAKNLFMILDCCFSGGAGAKVFLRDIQKRSIESTEFILSKIGGEGRLIFTASGIDEEAIEDRKKGHGIFSYYLIEALQGPESILESGSISLYKLLDYVTTKVVDAVSIFNHKQTPSFRGTVDGEVAFSPLNLGDIYQYYFPEKKQFTVSHNITDLINLGIPVEIIDIWKNQIKSLNDLQLKAINENGLMDDKHLLVSAPTSSGKTMVAEIAAIRAYFNHQKSCFLFPLRAIVNDKFIEFQERYTDFGIRIIRATGEISDDVPSLMGGKYDLCLMTYEKFSNLLLANPNLINNVGLIVVDEAQMLTDENRGLNLEFLLTILRIQRKINIEPQLVLLSAVIGNTNGLERWLNANILQTTERPVPLDEGLILPNGSFKFINSDKLEEEISNYIRIFSRRGSSQDYIIPLVQKLVDQGEKVLVFRSFKGETRGTANYLANNLNLLPANEVCDELPRGDPSASSSRLLNSLKGGVAFHNSDLDRDERLIIERAFVDPNSNLRVLVATTTLAMGVNTPASSVIVAGLTHPGNKPYSVAEYKNMVGRAGRLGYTEKGKSFLISSSLADAYRNWDNYINSSTEDLISQFSNGNLLTTIVRVLAAGSLTKTPGMSVDEIEGFLNNTLAVFQNVRTYSKNEISSGIGELVSSNLVEEEMGKYSLTPLGKLAGEMGLEVLSVIRLSNALSHLSVNQLTEESLISAVQSTVEMDDIYFPQNRRSTQERNRWRRSLSDFGIPREINQILESYVNDVADATARFKKAVSTIQWINGVDLADIETDLLQHYRDSDAAGSIRAAASRTRDIIPAAVQIAELSHNYEIDMSSQLDSLLIRLELGVTANMVPLAEILSNRLTRGDYKNLENADCLSIDSLEAVEEKDLTSIIGNQQRASIILNIIHNLKIKGAGVGG